MIEEKDRPAREAGSRLMLNSEPMLGDTEKASVSICSTTSVWTASGEAGISHRPFSTLLAVSESLASLIKWLWASAPRRV